MVNKTVGIKLNLLLEQEQELKELFGTFKIGMNWCVIEIEKRYQDFLKSYTPLSKENDVTGICAGCKAEKKLTYTHNASGRAYCSSCAMKTYSEYTVRKEIYGAGKRELDRDLADIIDLPNKTHYNSIYIQAYAMWKSYNAWRSKRNREREMLEKTVAELDQRWVKEALWIEQKAADLKQYNEKLTWKHAKLQASNEVYLHHTDTEKKAIAQAHDKIMDLKRLSRPIHFPQLTECRTISMDANFVKWEEGNLYLTLFSRGKRQIDFWGKAYLKQYIPKMEADNRVYCNLTKKNGEFYLMYPLEIKVRQPPDLKECDTFVFISSPTKIGIVNYDVDGAFNAVKFFPTSNLIFAKRHFKEKRAEITARKNDSEKMRKIRKRKRKILRRGNVEQRYVSTFNHQLTRKMIDHIMGQSENPKLLIWDVGNGITQNFGRKLNYLKNLWAVVQQQDYTKHKAQMMGIPVIEIQYNKCNNLTCSACGAQQKNGNKTAKAITQFIKGVKNFKCEKCGYEVNMLVNQANNVKDVHRAFL